MELENFAIKAKLFKALNHPVRLAILDILREDEACVCHMETILKRRQAYISQQLMILREAGLVQDRRDGLNIFYRICEPRIYAVIDAASQMIGPKTAKGHAEFKLKTNQIPCECPKCKQSTNVVATQGQTFAMETK